MHNPGWVDLQVNGCIGIDFASPELSADEILRAIDFMLSHGTAILLPTLVTSPPEVYRRNLPLIRRTVVTHGLEQAVPGVHLEGPFLSDRPGAIGAHNPNWVQTPTPEAVRSIFNEAEGFISLLTIAAEIPGAPAAIQAARALGIAVSVGHHLAGSEELAAAAHAGAQALTHLGNGLPNLLPRHHNPLLAGLAADELTAMIITDGHHLPEHVIRVVAKCKGAEKIIVTSDASPATGFAPGPCHVLGNDAILEKTGRLYNPVKQCLVGSAATLAMCMNHLESLGLFTDDELKKVGRENALALLEKK